MRTSFVVMAAIVTFMSGSNAIQITGDDKYERVLRKPMAIKNTKLNDTDDHETPSHTEPTVTPSDDKDDELEKKPKRRDGGLSKKDKEAAI